MEAIGKVEKFPLPVVQLLYGFLRLDGVSANVVIDPRGDVLGWRIVGAQRFS